EDADTKGMTLLAVLLERDWLHVATGSVQLVAINTVQSASIAFLLRRIDVRNRQDTLRSEVLLVVEANRPRVGRLLLPEAEIGMIGEVAKCPRVCFPIQMCGIEIAMA